eukprot:2927183-Pleurochrysis_carterae.AAC.3
MHGVASFGELSIVPSFDEVAGLEGMQSPRLPCIGTGAASGGGGGAQPRLYYTWALLDARLSTSAYLPTRLERGRSATRKERRALVEMQSVASRHLRSVAE